MLLTVLSSSEYIAVRAQTTQPQSVLLQQYAGSWGSSQSPISNKAVKQPHIIMHCVPTLKGNGLQVVVSEQKDGQYKPILSEFIVYDSLTDTIVALGKNQKGDVFIGKGKFMTDQHWVMQDTDLTGMPTQLVTFRFLNKDEVMVEGKNQKNETLWKVRYIRSVTGINE